MPQRADELSLLQAQMVYKKRLEAMMTELRSQEAVLAKKTAELEKTKLLEQKDVDRLNGRSLAAFFYNVTGKRDEMLDKERREAYAAQVKYEAARRELEAVREDIRETELDLLDLKDCEANYAQKLELKRQAIEAAGTPQGENLLELGQRLRYLEGQAKELEEAIGAGTEALRTVSEVLNNLNSAKDWCHLDVLGGGLLTDIAKHEKLDEAQHNVEQLQVQLQRFNKELSDVSIRTDLQVSIDRILKFADFFLDSLLADLAIREKINAAYTQADQTREQILGVLRHLQFSLEQVHHQQLRLRKELEAMVLDTEI